MATIKKTVQLDFSGQFKEIEEGLKKALNAASSKDVGKGFKEKFEKDIKEIQTLLTSLKKKADAPFTEGGLRTFEGQLNTLSRKLKTMGVEMKDFKFDNKYLKENSKEIQDLSNKLDELIRKRKELEDFKPGQTPTGKGAGAAKTALGDAQKLAQSGDIKGARALLKQQAGVLDTQATNATGPAAAQYAANSKILMDYAKSLTQTSKLITQTDKEIDTLSKDLNDKLTKGYDNASKSANNANANIENTNKTVEEMGDKTRQGAEALQHLDQASEKMNGIKNAVNRFIGFTAILHTMRRAIRSIFNDFKELDSQFNAIAIVSGKSMQELWSGFDKVNDIAKQYGVTAKDVVSVQKLYYQQGLQTADVNRLTAETLTLAKISGLDYAEATDKMTAAIRAFNIASEDAARVTDTLAALSSNAAATSEEIANALTKTASIAGSAGMSLESTSAFLTKMIETTRESATNIGTALKTVVARFTEVKDSTDDMEASLSSFNVNKVEKALKSVGVRLRDSSGQIRDLDKVFMELSKQWDGLDRNTQRYIATLAAGSRQQSRFIAMIEDYDRNLELMNIAQEAAGTGAIQLATSMDSIQSHLNILQSAWQDFYTNFISSDFFTFIIDGLTSIIGAFEQMGPLLTSIFLLVGTTGVKSIANYMSNLIMLTMAQRANTIAMNKAKTDEEKKMFADKLADIQVKKNTGGILANAIAKLFNIEVSKAGAIGVGIAAAAVAVMTGIVIANTIAINNNTQTQLANEKATTETTAAIKNNEKQIASTTNILIKYNRALELTKKGELATAEEKEELVELLDELEKLYPTLVTNEGEHNKALNQQDEILKGLIEKQDQYIENNRKIVESNKALISLYGKGYAGSSAEKLLNQYSNILGDIAQESDIVLMKTLGLKNSADVEDWRQRIQIAQSKSIWSKEGIEQLLKTPLTENEYQLYYKMLTTGKKWTWDSSGNLFSTDEEIKSIDQVLSVMDDYNTLYGSSYHQITNGDKERFLNLLGMIQNIQGNYGIDANKDFAVASIEASQQTQSKMELSNISAAMKRVAQDYKKTMSESLIDVFMDDNEDIAKQRVNAFYSELSEERQAAYEEYITSLEDQNLTTENLNKILAELGLPDDSLVKQVFIEKWNNLVAENDEVRRGILAKWSSVGIEQDSEFLLGFTPNQLESYRATVSEVYANFGAEGANAFIKAYEEAWETKGVSEELTKMTPEKWLNEDDVSRLRQRLIDLGVNEDTVNRIIVQSTSAARRKGIDYDTVLKNSINYEKLAQDMGNAIDEGLSMSDMESFIERMGQVGVDIGWGDFTEVDGKFQIAEDRLDEFVENMKQKYEVIYNQQLLLAEAAAEQYGKDSDQYKMAMNTVRATELQWAAFLGSLSKHYENKAKKLKEIYEAIDSYHNTDQLQEYYNTMIDDLNKELELTLNIGQATQLTTKNMQALNHQIALSAAESEKSASRMEKMRKAISAKYGKYVQFDSNLDYMALYNMDKIQSKLSAEEIKNLKEMVDEYEKEFQIHQENNKAVKEQIALQKQLIRTQRENLTTLEKKLSELMIQEDQAIIDSVQKRYEAIQNEDSKYLDSLRKTIEKERQIRDRANSEQDLKDKEYRLMMLKLDTSGVYNNEIKSLEKEIANDRQSLMDQRQDDLIDSLEEENNIKAEAMNKEVEYLQNVQDHKVEVMTYYNARIQKLIDEGYDAVVNYMKSVDKEFITSTEAAQAIWLEDWEMNTTKALSANEILKDENSIFTEVEKEIRKLMESGDDWETKFNDFLNDVNTGELAENNTLKQLDDKYQTLIGDVGKLLAAWRSAKKEINEGLDGLGLGDMGKPVGSPDNRSYSGGGRNYFDVGGIGLVLVPMKFASGGVVDYTGPAWVDGTKSQPEAFLSATDTKLIASLRDTLRYETGLVTPQNAKPESQNITYNIDIKVDKVESDEDVDDLARQLEEKIVAVTKGNNYNLINRR